MEESVGMVEVMSWAAGDKCDEARKRRLFRGLVRGGGLREPWEPG